VTYQSNETIQKLKSIEERLQNNANETTELKGIVGELKNVVQSLDKNAAIQDQKHSHLFYRVEQLQKEIELIESKGDKKGDSQRALVEKALMAFLGGLITYLFSLLGGGK
jgi:chromosome segregation ATPase